jgi:hypothetical protein
LTLTWEELNKRPPRRRFLLERPGDLSIDVTHSHFRVRLLPALVSSLERKESGWSVAVPKSGQSFIAEKISDIEGYYEGLWSRVSSRRLQKASLSGLSNAPGTARGFEGSPGPAALLMDQDGAKLRLWDLHLRRVEEAAYTVEVKWLPDLPCGFPGGASGAIPLSRLASLGVVRRPDPLLLKLKYKDGGEGETECDSHLGEFEVLVLGGFNELGEVQIPLADVQGIQFLSSAAPAKSDAHNASPSLVRKSSAGEKEPPPKTEVSNGSLGLVAAAGGDDIEAVKARLASGADPNQVDNSQIKGWTPLMAAARSGRISIAEVLLKAGANPNAQNEYGGTALDITRANGHSAIVQLLQAAGGRGRGDGR